MGDRITIWEYTTNNLNCVKTLKGHYESVKDIAQIESKNKEEFLLASVGEDGMLKIWDIKKGRCKKTLYYDKPVMSVVFNARLNGICYTVMDEGAKVLDINNYKIIQEFGKTHYSRLRQIDLKGAETLVKYNYHGTIEFYELIN